MEKLGLGRDETITGGLILGYGHDGRPVRGELERTGNPVTWICDAESKVRLGRTNPRRGQPV